MSGYRHEHLPPAVSGRMDPAMFLGRFDGQSKLLVRALLCGSSGAHRALEVFHRQQRANPDMSLSNFIETLCQDEVCGPDRTGQPLIVGPLVWLFTALLKKTLLSFIHLVYLSIPCPPVLHLLKCLSQDPHRTPWMTAMIRQLERNLEVHNEEPLYTPHCGQRLKELSQRLVGSDETGGWAKCFSRQTSECERASGSSELGTQRKRKGSFLALDSDGEDTGQESKRIKVEVCGSESLDDEEKSTTTELSGRLGNDAPAETPAEERTPAAAESPSDVLPEHIKVSVLQIKELLESQTEWDQSSMQMFEVLNDCDPGQVELLCSMLRFPDLPEQTLPKLCSSILAPSFDFSYSTAATLIKSLLLQKILSLSEPASRCLVTAGTSLCSRYPRPMCHALIGPVLEEKTIGGERVERQLSAGISYRREPQHYDFYLNYSSFALSSGNPQAELLNRLVESCLDSHYRLLVLQMTFKMTWSEAVLSIIHSLLDSKLDLSEELFTQFTGQLVSQGPKFNKSVKFAKMMLTVLTKYNSHVTAEHKQSLHSCLMVNESFLKKSLQAALKRITNS
ncbi:hypothetical protein F7725_000633 [Dissostichus mawsoni]|uniref:Fanconi Anaemia group E protein C-terminal domain-containing protein n=1 Tax=Dissostichus mawsoni TaxID=36200 RepID=A0A7J5ZJ89_DISMA|nr:hypothetical protein F7725_000633 [Dissostichus mawsoni]